MSDRLTRLRTRMEEQEIDGLLVTNPENRRYLSGFVGTAGFLLITQDQAILATDFRYVEQAGKQAPEFSITRITSPYSWLPEILGELGSKSIGFESSDLTVASHKSFLDGLSNANLDKNLSFLPTIGMVEPLRAVKDPNEINLISRAMAIADTAFLEVSSSIEIGETEQSVAWRLERCMRENGAEALAFETIVAAGPNAALPHHRADDTPITEGVPVVIDFGARYQGYNSDMTRTICLGGPDETFRIVYDTVLGAQLTASATILEGMTSGEADEIARDIIEKAGFGDKFGHSLGHGIGLAVHEEPRVGPRSEMIISDQVVFTIEPGIYIPGWGGVRIEDTVVMEKGKVRSITQSHKRDNPK